MCDPITAAVVLGGASSIMSYKQQEAQYEAQEQAYLNNVESANSDARNEHASMNIALQQKQDGAADKLQTNKLEAMRTESSARTSAGESGVGGNSVAVMLRDINRQNSTRSLAINRNLGSETQQVQVDRRASETNRQTRINSVARPKWDGAMVTTSALLSGAGTGMSTYGATS